MHANIVKQIKLKGVACGLNTHVAEKVERLHDMENTRMRQTLAIAIERAVTHEFFMQESSVTCQGAAYKPIVKDILLLLKKDNQLHKIQIPGISKFTKPNIS